MGVYQNTQTMVDGVVNDLTIFRDMVGEKDPSKEKAYGFVPGLGMSNVAGALEEQAQQLREGIFQVLFTGGFSSGKSTLLNALMRKNLLKTGINPETAVITKIMFGAEEKVIVYKNTVSAATGQQDTETLTVDQFFEKYRVDQDDPEMFANVDYVQLQQAEEGIASRLVQFVDSPGTQNSKADDNTAHDFAKKASAIVYLVNATKPFELEEKEYIKLHFAGKHLTNLFFIINRFDGVNEDQVEPLKGNVRKQLEAVFTDENGVFDQALFNSRVFYTNAYGSLAARCPEVKIKYPVPDSETGVPAFEKTLGLYLTDGDRDKSALKDYVSRLAGYYAAASEKIRDQQAQYEGGLEAAKKVKQEKEENIERLNAKMEQIVTACKVAAESISQGVKQSYDDCVESIDAGWEEHFSANCPKFGVGDVIRVALSHNEDRKAERLQPILSSVQGYVEGKIKTVLQPGMDHTITDALNNLEKQMNAYQEQLDALGGGVDVSELLKDVAGATIADDPTDLSFKPNMFQLVVGLLGKDLDTMGDALTGMKSNTEVIKDFIFHNIFELIAWNIAWPIGIPMLIYRLVQMIKGTNNIGSYTALQLINGMKKDTVDALRENRSQVVMDTETKVGGPVIRSGVAIADKFKKELADQQKALDTIIEDLSRDGFDYETEKARTNSILTKMAEAINDVSVRVTGKGVDPAYIEKLTAGEAVTA